jgi:large subunit ribosomal protein L2
MAVVKTKPLRRTTLRHQGRQSGVHKGEPYWPLVEARTRKAVATTPAASPRATRAAVTSSIIDVIDFKRDKDGIPATVERIEYDPNRTANIALLNIATASAVHRRPRGITAGDQLMSGSTAPIRAGNAMQLRNVPLGSVVHCVELKAGKGAQLARSAGGPAQLVARKVPTRRCVCAPAKCGAC